MASIKLKQVVLPAMVNYDGKNLTRISSDDVNPKCLRLEYDEEHRMILVQFEGKDLSMTPVEQVARFVPMSEVRRETPANPLAGLEVNPITGEAKRIPETRPVGVVSEAKARRMENVVPPPPKAVEVVLVPYDDDPAVVAPVVEHVKRGRPRRR